ncbi:MAG: T9SS type A sorting domain-containing protein, partial [Bacteroidota bacterium]
DAGDEEIFTDLEMNLDQNFPNPFVEETTIRFSLPEAGEATISILDLHGRVLTDITREFAAGPNTVTLDGNKFISGVFVYTLTYKGERLTRSMIRR